MSYMPASLAFVLANLHRPLLYETSLPRIRIEVNKTMEQNRIKREQFNENVLGGKGIYYN